MKKIVLMLLVTMVPFLTMAQKRSKKEKNTKIEKVVRSNSGIKYMIIKGAEIPKNSRRINEDPWSTTYTSCIFNHHFPYVPILRYDSPTSQSPHLFSLLVLPLLHRPLPTF